MKTIKNVLLAGLLLAPAATAQTVVTAGDSTAPWLGFMNVFELDCVAFAFQSGWGVPDLEATFDDMAGTIDFTACPIPTNDQFWYTGMAMMPGGPGVPGNKCMDATLYVQVDDDSLAGQNLSFEGTVLSNTLVAPSGMLGPIDGWVAEIFIRDFAPDFSAFNEISIAATPGPFSISMMTDPGLGRHIQYGYQIIGPNVWPGDQSLAGKVVLGTGPPSGTFNNSCNGDGGDQMGCTNCPCGNNSPIGTIGGCINSANTSTNLGASGSPSVSIPSGSSADLRFGLSGAPANAFCILNSGDNVAPTGMANPCFGLNSGVQSSQFDGLRCAVGNTRRHGGRSADANGEVGVTNNPWGGEGGPPPGIAIAGGGFAAGQTRYFQVIHRDDAMLACLTGLNTSQAVEVTFTP